MQDSVNGMSKKNKKNVFLPLNFNPQNLEVSFIVYIYIYKALNQSHC